jgi:hypothetical protein
LGALTTRFCSVPAQSKTGRDPLFLFAGPSTGISARYERNGERGSFPATVLSARGRFRPILSLSTIGEVPARSPELITLRFSSHERDQRAKCSTPDIRRRQQRVLADAHPFALHVDRSRGRLRRIGIDKKDFPVFASTPNAASRETVFQSAPRSGHEEVRNVASEHGS